MLANTMDEVVCNSISCALQMFFFKKWESTSDYDLSHIFYGYICQEKKPLYSEIILHTPLTARSEGQLLVAATAFLTLTSAILHLPLYPQG